MSLRRGTRSESSIIALLDVDAMIGVLGTIRELVGVVREHATNGGLP